MDAVLRQTPVRASYQAIRAVLEHNREVAKDQPDYWGKDRNSAGEYLEAFPDWEKKIRRYLHSLREQGERVVYVDVCGRTTARSLGADRHYSFSLQSPDWHFLKSEDDVRIQGDIFRARDFYSFVNLLHENGDHPAFVTFEPVAGLQKFTPPGQNAKGLPFQAEVTYQRLENNLARMLRVLRPGGFIFLERPFQFDRFGMRDFILGKPVEQYELSLWMSVFCKKYKCKLEMGRSIHGPRYLICKRAPKKERNARAAC
jgi:hypothetical protein